MNMNDEVPALETTNQKAVRRGLIAAVAAGLLQGSWAIYANFEHTQFEYMRAGAVQATNSFVMSFVITVFMEYVVVVFGKFSRGLGLFILSLIASFACMFTIHYSSNFIFGTPNILKTIAPAITIGTVYCSSYLLARIDITFLTKWKRRFQRNP